MKTSIYYFCIAYLICSKTIESKINHCLVMAYVMHHLLHCLFTTEIPYISFHLKAASP